MSDAAVRDEPRLEMEKGLPLRCEGVGLLFWLLAACRLLAELLGPQLSKSVEDIRRHREATTCRTGTQNCQAGACVVEELALTVREHTAPCDSS